ncbi:MAG: hypothetical protein PVH88_07190 [Ignavibacteria bacterium]
MSNETKCISVNLSETDVQKIKTIKAETGKTQNTILKECIENGLSKYLLGNKKLFWIKVRIDKDKMMELGQKLKSRELYTGMIKFTYCLKDDPTVGIGLWEVEDRQDLEQLLEPIKVYYKEIIEIKEAVFPETAMKLILESL